VVSTSDSKVAVVTGASRGVGKGIARALADAGYHVYATGRTVTPDPVQPRIVAVPFDITDDQAVADCFARVAADRGRLDVLVNSAWGGYEQMVEDGKFTWAVPFWQQPAWRWDKMVTVGVRAAFIASQHAAHLMLPAKRGLIVHLSSWPAQKYIGNVPYGVSKAATDKLAADMAHELAPHGIHVVSLYPGLVRTEAVLAAKVFDLSNSESPEFVGRTIAALADGNAAAHNGQVVVAAAFARDHGVTDIDGKQPRPLTLSEV
jgi:NAD(P)-dependent dehydrogenase (short-subunit alcohol dehydrogenase family)